MLKAIHKPTGKIVPAFKFISDASWIGKEKDILLAPYPEVYNWKFLKEKGITEVEVSFIKGYTREDNVRVVSHFRIKTEYAIPTPNNESEEHKLAKEGIYEDVLNNKITINKKGIRDLFNIDDIDFEYHISKSQCSKIADVIVTFKEKDLQYGRGIIFEVQLSGQNFECTEDRTYQRVIEGYSVVWLWDGMFGEDNKLLDKDVSVIPFTKAIEEYHIKKKLEYYKEINKYGELIDNKKEEAIKEFNLCLDNLNSNKKIVENETKNSINKIWESTKEIIETREKEMTSKFQEKYNYLLNKLRNDSPLLENLKGNINYEQLADSINRKEIDLLRDSLQKKIEVDVSKYITENISGELLKEMMNKLQEETKEKIKNTLDNFKMLDITGDIWFECKGCKKKIPYKLCEFDCSNPYCSKCFNSLEDNWIKTFRRWENKKIKSKGEFTLKDY